jgi:hypothetical protein
LVTPDPRTPIDAIIGDKKSCLGKATTGGRDEIANAIAPMASGPTSSHKSFLGRTAWLRIETA